MCVFTSVVGCGKCGKRVLRSKCLLRLRSAHGLLLAYTDCLDCLDCLDLHYAKPKGEEDTVSGRKTNRGYYSRRFHVQSFGHVFQVLIKLPRKQIVFAAELIVVGRDRYREVPRLLRRS